MKKHLLKLAILVLLLTLPTIKNTNSYYSDEKKIVANSISTGYWITDNTNPLPASLTVTDSSWSKTVDEKITNGNFETNLNGWTTAGDVSFSAGKVLIGKISGDDGKQVWENRLMQSFDSGAKTLSFDYDFHTLDSFYDMPGFFARLNGQQIFSLDAASANSGWQTFNYDLSNYADGQKLNLAIYAGNTGDTDYQSWAFIDKITTTSVVAPTDATYNLSGSDSDINHFEYKIGVLPWKDGDSFTDLPEGSHTVQYRSVDNSGNFSEISTTEIITDDTPPSKITDLGVAPYVNSATLTWTAPPDAASYDVRYSTSIISDANFSTETKVDKVPAPKSGQIEGLEILGLNPGTLYYFAVKSSDAAPNISEMSDVVSATTLPGETLNPGDLVINEVMWSGSDQFIELRNMTDRTISLEKIKLILNGINLGINFSGKSISPHGYHVINGTFTDGELELTNDGELIDKTEAFVGDATHSMERTSVPGLGSNPLSWYICLEGNTKGVENRSVNEPVLLKPFITLSKTDKDISFKVENIGGYTDPNYELTYDTDTVPQGVVGKGLNETITLGTCSTGGTCVYHTGVKNIKLKVYLTDSLGKIMMLEGGEK